MRVLLLLLYTLSATAQAATTWAATTKGIYKSNDAGVTWQSVKVTVSNPLFQGVPNAVTIVVDPINSAIVYFLGRSFSASSGFYKTTDGGQTWSVVLLPGVSLPNIGNGQHPYDYSLLVDPVATNNMYIFFLGKAARSNAGGLAKAYALRVAGNGNMFIEDVYDIDANGDVIARPITISNGDQVTLFVYGTGFRAAGGDVSATIGGINAPVLYAGPQGVQPGIDQFNLLLLPELAAGGAQSVPIVFTASGRTANTVYVTVQ